METSLNESEAVGKWQKIRYWFGNNWVFLFPFFVLLAALLLLLIYSKTAPSVNSYFRQILSFRDAPAWGQFGDFIGGLLNPIISMFTLVIAVLVWKLQKKELLETRSAIKEQTFDQFFMSMLASHRAMTEQVVYVDSNGKTLHTGKRAIDSYVAILTEETRSINRMPLADEAGQELCRLFPVNFKPYGMAIFAFAKFCTRYYGKELLCQSIEMRIKSYELTFEQLFGHIFRSTYQTLKIVVLQFSTNVKAKKKYVNLLRAQMSESEFILFALSGLTADGEKSWARSVRLDFFEDRLQNSDWTKSVANLFEANDANIRRSTELLSKE